MPDVSLFFSHEPHEKIYLSLGVFPQSMPTAGQIFLWSVVVGVDIRYENLCTKHIHCFLAG